MSVILLSTDNCPNCELLKRYLNGHGLSYNVREYKKDAEGITDLRTDGYFILSFPALVVNGRLHHFNELFAADGQVMDLVGGILSGMGD